MNSLAGQITQVEVNGNLSIVSVAVSEQLLLKAIVIETPITASYLVQGHACKVLFKETEVVIGLGQLDNISLQNRISGSIQSIQEGALLSKICLNSPVGIVTSIISTNAVRQLGLQAGIKATAMIKLNEVMLAKI